MANKPNNPSLWSKAKSLAKQKFDVYPSAYANGWAAKWYKSKGGTWRKAQYGMEVPMMEDGGKPEWLLKAQLKAQGYSGNALDQKLAAMAQGGEPQNAGFQALPEYVQNKIMNNMAYGGYIPEMAAGGWAQQAAIAIAMKKAGKKPKSMDKGGEPDGEMALGQIAAVVDKMDKLRQFIGPDSDLEPWVSSKLAVMDHYADAVSDYMTYGAEGDEEMEESEMEESEMEEMKMGGIPQRYKNMGFNKVGVKKDSNRPGKKWMVLAKKGDQYKVVHGGYTGMKDYTQHGSEKRRENFWNRMGGRNSSKATDPFSPLYWHKRFGTWEDGGEIDFMADGGQAAAYNGSIVNYLAAKGKAFDKESRAKLAAERGIKDYDFSAEKNTELLNLLLNEEGSPENTAFLRQKSIQKGINDSKSNPSISREDQGSWQDLSRGSVKPAKPIVTNKPVTKEKPVTDKKTERKLPNKQVQTFDPFKAFSPNLPNIGSDPFSVNIPLKPQLDFSNADLQSGTIVDKGTNTMYMVQNGKVVRQFPVLTGQAGRNLETDPDSNPYTVSYLEKNPELRSTPRGAYVMQPGVVYGNKGYTLKPISAYGNMPPNDTYAGMHITYGAPADSRINQSELRGGQKAHPNKAEFQRRNAGYSLPGNQRYKSFGCTNMQGETIDCLTGAFPQGDTAIYVDSRRAGDKAFVQRMAGKKQEGGSTWSGNAWYNMGGYVPEYGMGGMPCYECGGMYAEGGESEMMAPDPGGPRFGKGYGKRGFMGIKPVKQWTGRNDSRLENVLEFFDPTGISSWDDLAGDIRENKGKKRNWLRTASNVLSVIPRFRALYPGITFANDLPKYVQIAAPARAAGDATKFWRHMEDMSNGAVDIMGGDYKNGGGIYINPANKGKFTATAKRAGMGVQEFAAHVLANKEDYSTTQVRRANFARNAANWKKQLGGPVEGEVMDVTPEQLEELRRQGYQFEMI